MITMQYNVQVIRIPGGIHRRVPKKLTASTTGLGKPHCSCVILNSRLSTMRQPSLVFILWYIDVVGSALTFSEMST
jgi:hypothetical protein